MGKSERLLPQEHTKGRCGFGPLGGCQYILLCIISTITVSSCKSSHILWQFVFRPQMWWCVLHHFVQPTNSLHVLCCIKSSMAPSLLQPLRVSTALSRLHAVYYTSRIYASHCSEYIHVSCSVKFAHFLNICLTCIHTHTTTAQFALFQWRLPKSVHSWERERKSWKKFVEPRWTKWDFQGTLEERRFCGLVQDWEWKT